MYTSIHNTYYGTKFTKLNLIPRFVYLFKSGRECRNYSKE